MSSLQNRAEQVVERTKGRVFSNKNYNKSFELEGRLRCAAAVVETADKRVVEAHTELRAAIALLQRFLDILNERDRAGQVDLGRSGAYGDLWEDARVCVSLTEHMLALHDPSNPEVVPGSSEGASGAQKRSKRR